MGPVARVSFGSTVAVRLSALAIARLQGPGPEIADIGDFVENLLTTGDKLFNR